MPQCFLHTLFSELVRRFLSFTITNPKRQASDFQSNLRGFLSPIHAQHGIVVPVEETIYEMELSVDECNVRRLKRVIVKQEFSKFSIAAGQCPAEIVVLQQFEYIGDAGQPGNRLVGFSSEEEISGQQLHLIFNDLTGNGFASGAGWGCGFNVSDRLVDVIGNGRFCARPAKEAAIAPRFLVHTTSPFATESARGSHSATLSRSYNFALRN